MLAQEEERLRKGEFTLDDFRKQMIQISRLGPLQKVMGMIPGMGSLMKHLDDVDAEQGMKRMLGIVDSMTADEKRNPTKVIDQDAAGGSPRGRGQTRSERTGEAVQRHVAGDDRHGRAKG